MSEMNAASAGLQTASLGDEIVGRINRLAAISETPEHLARLFLTHEHRAAADDQARVFRNVDLINLNVSAELPGRIEEFPLFDQMPVHLLDEVWISLGFLEDEAHQKLRNNLALA